MSEFIFQNPRAVRRFGTMLIIGVSVLIILIALMIWNFTAQRFANIDELNATIARAEQLSNASRANSAQVSFYQNETPQLSQSEMQSDMQDLAQQYQVRLEVIRADQIEQVQGNVRMALTLNGVVPENQLGGYLQNLAAHEPMVIVDNINLRRARGTRNNEERLLAIQLKLSGFSTQ
ncbi:GspMb/PilO family protein [Yoonia sp. BS5-3]|uniref:GspMb/PilO family protein n=1 Tax=Yoonia phaeophyticola TaxID=3137369 RepID=A0ABZ2V542_9RHOB